MSRNYVTNNAYDSLLCVGVVSNICVETQFFVLEFRKRVAVKTPLTKCRLYLYVYTFRFYFHPAAHTGYVYIYIYICTA